MSSNKYTISVIIPTNNRKEILVQTLDALSTQTYSLKDIEVIVVADGCTDGTADFLKSYSSPYELRVLEQDRKGPGPARNQGASKALGSLFLFLDDDVMPCSELIEEHLKTHKDYPGHVVVGYISLMPQYKKDLFYIELRSWWDMILSEMFYQGHRFKYSDLLGGNFSIRADIFNSLDGFNPIFLIHEDSEFGMRLMKTGIPITTNIKAKGYHCDKTTSDRFIRKKFQDGRADILMIRTHPQLLATLTSFKFPKNFLSMKQIYINFVSNMSNLTDFIASLLYPILDLLEHLKLRRLWRMLFYGLCEYWWWRGATEEVGTKGALLELANRSAGDNITDIPSLEIDLSKGIEYAEELLDKEKPRSATIRYGKHIIGVIPDEPGAEALKGSHLRPILGGELATQLLIALASTGAIVSSSEVELLKLTNSIRKKSVFGGKLTLEKIWSDRFSQWMNQQGNDLGSTVEFWDIQNKINELEQKKAVVEGDWIKFKQVAEEQKHTMDQQQKIIKYLTHSITSCSNEAITEE